MTTQKKVRNAIKWIDGLKKTRFKKGIKKLGDKVDGFCCLGYGCHVLKVPYDPNVGVSEEFQKAVGLKGSSGGFQVNGCGISLKIVDDGVEDHFYTLASINDNTSYKLKDMADVILKRIDLLFIEDVAIELKKHYEV